MIPLLNPPYHLVLLYSFSKELMVSLPPFTLYIQSLIFLEDGLSM